MWPEAESTFTQDEFEAWQRNRIPPDNEMFTAVALNKVLIDTSDTVLWLSHADCYSTGVALHFQARTRRPAVDPENSRSSMLMDLLPPRAGTADGVRLLVDLPNGVSVSDARKQNPDRQYLLSARGSTAGFATASASWWLSPFPAETFTVRALWPAVGSEPADGWTCDVNGRSLIEARTSKGLLWTWD